MREVAVQHPAGTLSETNTKPKLNMTTPNQDQQLNPLQSAALKRKLVEAEIISRAWSDETFRKQLESDPKAALEEAGFPVPEGTSVSVTSEPASAIKIVLPPKPQAASELAEDELSAVAGGGPGAIETGRCEKMEEGKALYRRDNTRFFGAVDILATAAGGLIGYSWAWQ